MEFLTSLLMFLGTNWLETAVSLLAFLNGCILLTNFLRDRPKLVVSPVHPETYQWWFKFPEFEGPNGKTSGIGFLAYIGISNRGMRPVSPIQVRLQFRAGNLKSFHAPMETIPPPTLTLKNRDFNFSKRIPALLQNDPDYPPTENGYIIPSGGSTAGMALFTYHWWGHPSWGPKTVNDTISTKILVKDVYGKVSKCKFQFRELPIDKIREIIPGFENIVDQNLKSVGAKSSF